MFHFINSLVAYYKFYKSKSWDCSYYISKVNLKSKLSIFIYLHFIFFGIKRNYQPSKHFDINLYRYLYGNVNPIVDSVLNKRITDLNQSFAPKNELRIAVRSIWGLGDLIVDLNYLISIVMELKNENVRFTVFTKKNHTNLFDGCANNYFSVKEFSSNQECYENYDLYFISDDLWIPVKYNLQKIHLFSRKLCLLVEKNLTIKSEIFKKDIINECCYESFCRLRKITRHQFMDPYSVFVSNYYNAWMNTISTLDPSYTLKKFNLDNVKYITLNCCSDFNYSKHNIKIWGMENYLQLVKLLKDRLPSYKIVQIGVGPDDRIIPNVDINLLNQTNFKDLKCLLKYNEIHIDCEGGLVHLSHALGKKSVVIFGPTSSTEYGYPDNINIQGESCCSYGCVHVFENWHSKCVCDEKLHCMKNITPSLVCSKICEFFLAM